MYSFSTRPPYPKRIEQQRRLTDVGHFDIDTKSDTKKYRIYERDHLGSTRAVIDEAGEL